MIGLPPFGSQKELHFFVSKQEFSKPSKSHNYLRQMKKGCHLLILGTDSKQNQII
jgi:hypothetical protein